MRVTVYIPDEIGKDIKAFAEDENQSVSSVISEAVKQYVKIKKRRKTGTELLNLVGKVKITPQAYEEIDRGRQENDRS